MSSTYGVSSAGFTAKMQSEVINELNAALQTSLGGNLNLAPSSVLGQLVGIFSEREALLWQLAEGVYQSAFLSGAEGVAVDNLLAIAGLTRLAASATATNPAQTVTASGVTLYGLALYGTPGTVIPAGSFIQTASVPPVSFTLNASATIGAPVNCVQQVIFSGTPTSGSFSLGFTPPTGATVTVGPLTYGSSVAAMTGAIAQAYGQTITRHVVTAAISGDLTTNNQYQVQVDGNLWQRSPSPLDTQASVLGDMVAKLSPLLGPDFILTQLKDANGNIVDGPGALVTFTGPPDGSGMAFLQAAYLDLEETVHPSNGDISVTQGSNGYTIAFGSGTPSVAAQSTAATQIPLITVTSALFTGANAQTMVNASTAIATQGLPAMATGQATCTVTGPTYVPAGALSVIGSPITGWSGVTNQLDCITGSNTETDSAALTRRATRLGAPAHGPLASIVDAVASAPNVIAATGFQNVTMAAQQTVAFSPTPTSGSFVLVTPYGQTGQLSFVGGVGPTASQVQAAINAVGGGIYNSVVTGNATYGFVIDLNGSLGGQPQPLFGVAANATASIINIGYGRPPKSFEIVVNGGADTDIASAIASEAPAGITSYGTPSAITTASPTAGSLTLSVGSSGAAQVGNLVMGPGIVPGTAITSISGNTWSISQAVQVSQTSATYMAFSAATVSDTQGTPVLIRFSRPTTVLPYLSIALVTDYFNTPGNTASGVNPSSQFNPATISQIQMDIVNAGNAVPMGGLIIAQGYNGILASFASVPGVLDFGVTMQLGAQPAMPQPVGAPPPSNIPLLATQIAKFETANILVSYV